LSKYYHEKPASYIAVNLVACLSVGYPFVRQNRSVWIKENLRCMSEVEASLLETCLAFFFVPFEIHDEK